MNRPNGRARGPVLIPLGSLFLVLSYTGILPYLGKVRVNEDVALSDDLLFLLAFIALIIGLEFTTSGLLDLAARRREAAERRRSGKAHERATGGIGSTT